MKPSRSRATACTTAILVMLSLGACGGSTSPTTTSSSSGTGGGSTGGASLGTAALTIQATDGLKFDPATQAAKVGDIVEWVNGGSAPHNITFENDPNGAMTDSSFNASDKWQVKFTVAGTYTYKCTMHPGMVGTVTVS